MLLARPCEKTSFHLEKTIRFETKILFVLRHKLIHVRISLTTSCLNANLITVNTSSNKLVVSLLIEDCVKVVLLTQSKDVLISLKKTDVLRTPLPGGPRRPVVVRAKRLFCQAKL